MADDPKADRPAPDDRDGLAQGGGSKGSPIGGVERRDQFGMPSPATGSPGPDRPGTTGGDDTRDKD